MIDFYKKYRPLLDLNQSKYSVIVLTGGRGSEKTGHACRGILKCSAEKRKKTCFFRETKETISESLKAELEDLLETEFKGRGFKSNAQKIWHRNGSYMFFKGLKAVNKASIENLKGIAGSVDFFVVDEAQAVSKAVWDVLIPTVRKAGCVLIVIYNRTEEDLPVEEAFMLDYATMTAPAGTYFVEVNYPEIEHLGHLSPQFLQRALLIEQNKPEEYEVVYLNKPRGLNQNRVVKYWSKENLNDRINYCPGLDLHLSMDFNVDPMMWVIFHKTDNKMFVFDEIVMENVTTQDVADEFIRRYPNHKGRIILNGDASGKARKTQSKYSDYAIVKNTLLAAGYAEENIEIEIRRGNPPIRSRVNAFNQVVFNDKGERNLQIHPRCKWLLFNMSKLKYKPGTSVFELPSPAQIAADQSKTLKFLGHIFDAVSYPAEYYWPIIEKYGDD